MPDRTTPTDQGATERAGEQEAREAAWQRFMGLTHPDVRLLLEHKHTIKRAHGVGFSDGVAWAANQAPEVTEAAVERAARAVWEASGCVVPRWEEMSERERDWDRRLARAALTAALSPSSDTGEQP